MYRLSIAQIQFMAVDNTHTKYLKGADKKAWNNYKDAYDAMQRAESFMDSLKMPKDLAEGEVYEIPVHKNNKKK